MLFGFIDWIISAFLNSIGNLLNVVWGVLCIPIYLLISLLYDVFTTIPQIDFLKDIGIEDIYQRITMIMVIVMAFYITFEVVKYVVQPDIITDKEKGSGKLIQKIFIVILLLAFVPRIFSIAYDLQGRIIKGDVISVILLGRNDNEEGTFKTLGTNFSANLFGLFYTLNPETCPNGADTNAACQTGQVTIDGTLDLLRGSRITGAVGVLVGTLTSVIGNFIPTLFGKTVINFSGLLALGIGIYALWTLIIYSIEVAKRYFQLIYLQIMAPVAIIGYLAPQKDGMLSKWTKQCVTTYLDLFIRLLIINFVMLLSSILHNKFFGAESVLNSIATDGSNITWTPDTLIVTYLFLVIGLLTFALKAPKLLQELFPKGGAASGNFGLWEPTKSLISGTARSVGGTLGAIGAGKDAWQLAKNKGKGLKDKILGASFATFDSARAGFAKGGNLRKAQAAGRTAVEQQEKLYDENGSLWDATFHGHREAKKSHEYDRDKKHLEDAAKVKDDGKKIASGHGFMRQADSTKSELEHRNIADAASRAVWHKSMEKILPDLSIDYDKNKAKTKIENATHTLYETERNKINNNADIQKTIVQEEINVARNQHKQANDIISNYETFVEPLTERQLLEKEKALKTINITEQKIRESEDKLKEIENNQKVELSKINNEEKATAETMYSRIVETTTDSSGNVIETFADGALLEQMKNTYTQGYKDSAGTYVTPEGNEMTVFETEEEAIEIAEKRAKTSGRTVEEELQDVHNNHIDLATYVKNIGKIQDSANTQISNMSIDPKVRQAKANAEVSGKSGK